jgi:hypothetical protein
MSRKLLWVGSLLAMGLGTALTTRLVTSSPPQAAPSADVAHLSQRLARLENERSDSGRVFARSALNGAGRQLAVGGGTGTEPPDPAAEGEAEEKRQESFAQREGQHFDELDRQARAGNGAMALAQLQSNLQALRNLPPARRVPLQVASLECGEQLCRLELSGPTADPSKFIPEVLKGMGSNLSMRPTSAGRAIYYISAASKEIPPVAP